MARNEQFLELITRVRGETGRANSVAVGTDDVAAIKTAINRVYEGLWHDYDWPHLRKVFDKKTLSAGGQYVDFPAGLDVTRIESVTLWYNGFAYNIERGIQLTDYNLYDPTEDERSDPVLKWDVRHTGSGEQIEVWPLPATTQYLQFIGRLAFARLVNDEDQCKLDDTLVVLFTAAKMLRRQKAEDWRETYDAAQRHYTNLRISMKAGSTCQLGVPTDRDMTPPRAVVRVN